MRLISNFLQKIGRKTIIIALYKISRLSSTIRSDRKAGAEYTINVSERSSLCLKDLQIGHEE